MKKKKILSALLIISFMSIIIFDNVTPKAPSLHEIGYYKQNDTLIKEAN